MTLSPEAAATARQRLLALQRDAVLGDDNAEARDAALMEWRRARRAATWNREDAKVRFARWLLEATGTVEPPVD
jgi:hypothetical protein